MHHYDALAEEVRETARERDAVARTVETRLADVVAEAITETGANVEAVDQSRDGHQYRFEARLDRAAVTEGLPDGFVVEHVSDDGSLSIGWTGERETPAERDHGAVLKTIVAEEMETDTNGLGESVPTRERVLDRAVELGANRDGTAGRLRRLETVRVVEVSDDEGFPAKNFSRH
jgi:hypothetical protein